MSMHKAREEKCTQHLTTLVISFFRLEENVIAKDMCLVDNAINARKDSIICKSSTLMAAAPVAVMPLGQLMEILPVTKIQASASAKKMLLVSARQDSTSRHLCFFKT